MARGLLWRRPMGRIARGHLVVEKGTNHCTWRSHDNGRFFEEEGAREKFLELIVKYKARHQILVRSYCHMGTHPHVVCTSDGGQKAFSAFWKVVNQAFARWFNKRRNRCGQVVRERLKSPQIQDGRHQLVVMRYGDMNPVRAGLVKSPKDWQWSSYRHYAFGEPNALIDDAPEYLALGAHPVDRRKAYQALFARTLEEENVGVRRDDLVRAPFVGDVAWMAARLQALGPAPPRRPC
jgi:putative transposase